MTIEQRIKILQEKIDNNPKLKRYILMIQQDPATTKYDVKDTFKGITKEYVVDNGNEFYNSIKTDKVQEANTYIIKLNVAETRTMESVFNEEV